MAEEGCTFSSPFFLDLLKVTCAVNIVRVLWAIEAKFAKGGLFNWIVFIALANIILLIFPIFIFFFTGPGTVTLLFFRGMPRTKKKIFHERVLSIINSRATSVSILAIIIVITAHKVLTGIAANENVRSFKVLTEVINVRLLFTCVGHRSLL